MHGCSQNRPQGSAGPDCSCPPAPPHPSLQQGPELRGPTAGGKGGSHSIPTALFACPQGAFLGAAAALRGVQAHLLPHHQTCPESPARATAGQAPRRGLTAKGRDAVSCPQQSWPEKVQIRAAWGTEKSSQTFLPHPPFQLPACADIAEDFQGCMEQEEVREGFPAPSLGEIT